MQKLCTVVLGFAFLLALIGGCAARSHHPKPKPQAKTSQLSEQKTPTQPPPSANPLTVQQITEAIADGINAAAKEYEKRHSAMPPDNSLWWFNFWLVVFTGGLVAVGVAQSFLIFWTLKATQIAANAAKRAVDSLPVVERAYVYPVVVGHGAIEECIKNARAFYEDDPSKDDESARETAEITFKFKNFGKTPALLKSAFAGLGVAPLGAQLGLPIVESVLGTGEETVTPFVSEMQIGITPSQARHILDYTGHVCFEGRITFDDIWGNEQTTEFYFVWDHSISRMNLRWVETKTKQKDDEPLRTPAPRT